MRGKSTDWIAVVKIGDDNRPSLTIYCVSQMKNAGIVDSAVESDGATTGRPVNFRSVGNTAVIKVEGDLRIRDCDWVDNSQDSRAAGQSPSRTGRSDRIGDTIVSRSERRSGINIRSCSGNRHAVTQDLEGYPCGVAHRRAEC